MRTSMIRASAAAAAGVLAGTLGVTATGVAAQAAPPARTAAPLAPGTAAPGMAGSGAKLWVQRYNGPGDGEDAASSVAVSPDGGTVFVTGTSKGASPAPDTSDYLTVAYDAATGRRLWTARYDGPATYDQARAVAVSPDGATVFVTGSSDHGSGELGDYATVAYRAADGTQMWVARYNGPDNNADYAAALSVARDGSKVYVTGTSYAGVDDTAGFTTVAYRTTTGAQVWVARYAPGVGGSPRAIISPGGNRVFVTGHVQNLAYNAEYGTVAYNAATGARLWAHTYAGQGTSAIAASPDLATVYVTGESHFDYGTLAYNARTGGRRWARFYGGHPRVDDASSVAVSPRGTVLVTGLTWSGDATGYDYATVAYSPGGAQLWDQRYTGPGSGEDIPHAVAAPGDGRAYVTGTSPGASATGDDYATVAYNLRTGARLWVSRYNGPASGGDDAAALAASPGRVFVTGTSPAALTSGDDYATIAYQG